MQKKMCLIRDILMTERNGNKKYVREKRKCATRRMRMREHIRERKSEYTRVKARRWERERGEKICKRIHTRKNVIEIGRKRENACVCVRICACAHAI